MSSTLGDLLKGVAEPDRGSNFLAQFGMRRNPFPPARTIYPEVIYNQVEALRLFAEGVKGVLSDTPARRTLALLGGTGQGKSHFLRHCQYEVKRANIPLVTVEFLAGTSSAVVLVRDIYRAVDEHLKANGETDLLSAVVSRLEDNNFGPVRQTDLKSALATLRQASQPNSQPAGLHGQYTAEVLRDVCWRWLQGETLTQTERRYLHVSGRLSTASLMARVMTELFALARLQKHFQGIMICLDEVEAVFFSGVPVRRIQAFLQDMRYMFDEAVGQTSGYSLLILAGSTPRGATDLREYNYPLFQRLGFETEARISLHEVDTLDEARHFAEVYVRFELEEFNRERSANVAFEKARQLITEEDLERAFYGRNKAPSADVRNQARLLAELHRIVEEKDPARAIPAPQ